VDSHSRSRTLKRAIQCPILLDFWKAPIQAWAFQGRGHGFKPSALTISFPPLAEIHMKTHSVFKIYHLGMNDAVLSVPTQTSPGMPGSTGTYRHRFYGWTDGRAVAGV
jgi:hypothetical protein